MIDKKDKKTNKHKKVWICDYLKRHETKKNSVSGYRGKELVSNFFLFFLVVMAIIIAFCLFFRTIGFLPLIFAIFFIYSRISMNNKRWRKNYYLIKSNKWGYLFYKFMDFFAICFFVIIIYASLNHNYGLKIGIMDILLKNLISFENWLKLI